MYGGLNGDIVSIVSKGGVSKSQLTIGGEGGRGQLTKEGGGVSKGQQESVDNILPAALEEAKAESR